MSKRSKIIHGLDNEVYNDFVSICKKKGELISYRLNKLLSSYIKRYNRKQQNTKGETKWKKKIKKKT